MGVQVKISQLWLFLTAVLLMSNFAYSENAQKEFDQHWTLLKQIYSDPVLKPMRQNIGDIIAKELTPQIKLPHDFWSLAPQIDSESYVFSEAAAKRVPPTSQWTTKFWWEAPKYASSNHSPLRNEIYSKVAKSNSWPDAFRKAIPQILENTVAKPQEISVEFGDPAFSVRLALAQGLGLQKKLSKKMWDHALTLLSDPRYQREAYGRTIGHAVAESLSKRGDWPTPFMKSIAAQGCSTPCWVGLGNQKNWPEEVWTLATQRLGKANGAQEVASALGRRKWPKSFWNGLGDKLLQMNTKQLTEFLEAAKKQPEIPDAFWNKLGKAFSETELFYESKHSIADFISNQKKWPPSFWQKLPQIIAASTEKNLMVDLLKDSTWDRGFSKKVPDMIEDEDSRWVMKNALKGKPSLSLSRETTQLLLGYLEGDDSGKRRVASEILSSRNNLPQDTEKKLTRIASGTSDGKDTCKRILARVKKAKAASSLD